MCLRGLCILCLPIFASADLRMASRPKDAYYLKNQGTTPWQLGKEGHARYMEPSTFEYAKLEQQKKRNYDNFLRSNVDNEQDNRNFNNEDGKDHLPFRTYETAVFETYETEHNNKRQRIKQIPIPMMLSRSVKPGESVAVPIRWNNPHASEMEVNIWIFEHADKKPIVVPIRKPSCSAEGHQDNIIEFTVPSDFGTLGSKIPGFKGCKEESKPMCVLQIYAHSVESRTYAIGFPIMVPGHVESATPTSTNAIAKASEDPWLDLSSLRELCLPATDASATITSSNPRWARLVSDVYNHAYQNSDYSPYSGQQHEAISKNIQASAVNKMVTGNRGELGKSILPRDTSKKLKELRRLESKVYKEYETIANKIIQKMGSKMSSTGKIGNQNLANCFRCKEVGSTNTNRQTKNTYIPSFQLPQGLVDEAKTHVPPKFRSLITSSGVVQIYVAAMNDLLPYFQQSRHLGVIYQAPVLKSTMTTMADAKNFKKRNANNAQDNGKYAALEAKKQFVADRGCPSSCLYEKKSSLLQEEDDTEVTDVTIVKGTPCTGDDCKSVAECPSGYWVVKCDMNPLGDGVVPSPTKCTAYGKAKNEEYTALATCSKLQKTTVVKTEKSRVGQTTMMKAECRAGQIPVACNCHSHMRSCGQRISSVPWQGSSCELMIRRGARGVKVYALCAAGDGSVPQSDKRPGSQNAQRPPGRPGSQNAQRPPGAPQAPDATQMDSTCKWESHVGKCAGGGIDRWRPKDEVMRKCIKNQQCQAVTCKKEGSPCQMRRAGVDKFFNSMSGETTYTASFSCINGYPEGSVEKALVTDAFATKVTGECAKCAQFFGKLVPEAPLTTLDKAINSNKPINSGIGARPNNPDGFIQEQEMSKRSSRTALVRKARGKGQSAISVDASANVAPLP